MNMVMCATAKTVKGAPSPNVCAASIDLFSLLWLFKVCSPSRLLYGYSAGVVLVLFAFAF